MVNESQTDGSTASHSDNTEIELKLAANSKDFARVRRTTFWSESKRAQTRMLDSVYYDTTGHDLRVRGFSLRLRRVGHRYRQTFKVSDAGGYFERREFEVYLSEGKPDLTAIDDAAIRLQLAGITASELKPIFTTHVRRSRKLYQPEEGTIVEIALDEGEVRDDEGTTPLCEIELELKQGQPEALFDVARGLSDVIPVRLQIQSKSEIGYSHCEGRSEPWRTAGKLSLTDEMSAEVALDSIVEYAVSHILRNDQCARERSHVEGVHQVRVGLRRLRSGLHLFKSILPADQYAWISGEARFFARALGPARDLDVFRQETLPPVAEALGELGDFTAVDRMAARLQDEAYEMVREALSSDRFMTFMIELMRWRKTRAWHDEPASAKAAQWRAPITTLSGPLLSKRHKSVRKKGRGFADMPRAQRHSVRIAMKKLRYATDFFAALYPAKARRSYLRRVGRLQDDLGHLNDIVTLHEILDRIVAKNSCASLHRAAGCLIGWYEQKTAQDDEQLIREWRAFEKAKPFWK